MPNTAARPELTYAQRLSVEQARTLIAQSPEDLHAAESPELAHRSDLAHAYAYGRIEPYVKSLIAIIDELTAPKAEWFCTSCHGTYIASEPVCPNRECQPQARAGGAQ